MSVAPRAVLLEQKSPKPDQIEKTSICFGEGGNAAGASVQPAADVAARDARRVDAGTAADKIREGEVTLASEASAGAPVASGAAAYCIMKPTEGRWSGGPKPEQISIA